MTQILKSGKKWLIVAAVAAVYFSVYGYRLSFPILECYDEVHYVKVARSLMHFTGPIGDAHPPFAKYLMAVSMLIFGDQAWAWRVPSLLAGLASIFLIYGIANLLTQNRRIAFWAAFLFSFDFFAFTQARLGLLLGVSVSLTLASLYFMARYRFSPEASRRDLVLCAVFEGLAVASHLTALGALPLLALLGLRGFRPKEDKPAWRPVLQWTCVFLGAYFAVYLIMPFLRGGGYSWFSILKYQLGMLRFSLTYTEPHPHASAWWSWPLMLEPLWFHLGRNVYRILRAREEIRAIMGIGNPLIVWLMLPVLGYLSAQIVKTKPWICVFLLCGILSFWLPWALFSRTQFIYYLYPSIPFLAMAIALVLDRLWSYPKVGKTAVLAYLAAVVLLFVFWHPLLTGMPVDSAYFRAHLWIPQWFP